MAINIAENAGGKKNLKNKVFSVLAMIFFSL
jgi:hypothetical protein